MDWKKLGIAFLMASGLVAAIALFFFLLFISKGLTLLLFFFGWLVYTAYDSL